MHIADTMSNGDPRSAVEQLIAIFVAFWASDQNTLGNLYALGSNDPDFRAVLRARNERRYHAFSVLAARLVDRGDIRPDAADDVVDALFAHSSYAFFADLTGARTQHKRRARKHLGIGACGTVARARFRLIPRGSEPV